MPSQTSQAPPGGRGVRLPWWLVVVLCMPAVYNLAVFSYDMISMWMEPPHWQIPGNLLEDMGTDGVMLFQHHDRNDDGVLSLEEFEPLAHRLLEINETYSYERPIEESDEVLTIRTFFTPLDLKSMSKEWESLPYMPGTMDSFYGLKQWTKPFLEWRNFGASHFSCLLPKDPSMLQKVGTVYKIIEDEMGAGNVLSNNRYLPPKLHKEEERLVHRLLTLFHPKPFVIPRFAPRGGVAMVRAYNEQFVDIVFRIHSEFQLNDAPYFPYWYTPAYFTGHLIISKDGTHVHSFVMYVPTRRKLNVDMEWLTGPGDIENTEVDIGYMAEMRLEATRPSVPINHGGHDTRELPIPPMGGTETGPAPRWQQEMEEVATSRMLERAMYPFMQVTYHNLTEAFSLAESQQKLVHSILLWGSLDDQSC